MGPLCVLRAEALSHNLATMAQWCARHGVELAPHGKTHMAPQLVAKQFEAGCCAVTAATISQVRTYRAFGVRDVLLANELVDASGLAWLAAELDSDDEFRLLCWVDSVRGVELMTAALDAVGARRQVEVCVEVGAVGGRTGCRGADEVDAVAAAVLASPRLQLAGVAGYEAALGHDVSAAGIKRILLYLNEVRTAAERLAPLTHGREFVVTAGGSTHFDLVAAALTGDWRTILRSGAYLTHDDGLYLRTSPLGRPGSPPGGFEPALQLWAQVCSRPEPGLALLTMGRRDVSFDQDLPVPQRLRRGSDWTSDGLTGCEVVKLNDQHAFLKLSPSAEDAVTVGTWIQFGVSHPCTVFDKWQLIPVLDERDQVVEFVRTFF